VSCSSDKINSKKDSEKEAKRSSRKDKRNIGRTSEVTRVD
jgi:hypothetical protein